MIKNQIATIKALVNDQEGAVGYIFAWLMGVPVTLLLVIYLLRGHA